MNALTWAVLVVGLGVLVLLFYLARGRDEREAPPKIDAAKRGPEAAGRAEAILEHMGEGVLVLDRGLKLEFANASARSLLGLQEGPLPHRLTSPDVAEVARNALGGTPQVRMVDIWYPRRLTLEIEASALEKDSIVVLLRDASEEVWTQRIRTEFVAHASHELKSPVASLQALAEAVRDAARDDADVAERLSGRLVKEADRLGKLITDLLDLSRLEEAGRVPDDPCDLARIAREEVDRLEPSARGDIVALRADIEDPLWIKGDAQQLRLLVRNLLDNAIQYTPPGGRVTLSIAREGAEAVLRVTDTGVGIPSEAQPRVFERFYRVDEARSRDRGGTGLGLAIVKHVAELHQGSVEVTSEVGKGSTFSVHFPSLIEAAEGSAKESA
ncbi:MAG: ATP-binding protein [Actinomycetota bacterium]